MRNFFLKLSSLLVELYYFILYSNETLIVSDYAFEQKVNTNERILHIQDVWDNFRNNLDKLERDKKKEKEEKETKEKKELQDEEDWKNWDYSHTPMPIHPDFTGWEYSSL